MLRDPTRGGVAATLAEIATAAGVGIEIEEAAVPVRPAVASACELLGIDPLTVASEGRCVAIVPDEAAETALAALRAHALGREAVRLGSVVPRHPGVVSLVTTLGGRRVVPWPLGEHLPRIC